MGRESKVSIIVTARDNASKAVGKIRKSFASLGSFLSGPKGIIGTLTKFFGLFTAIRFVKGTVDAFAQQLSGSYR